MNSLLIKMAQAGKKKQVLDTRKILRGAPSLVITNVDRSSSLSSLSDSGDAGSDGADEDSDDDL